MMCSSIFIIQVGILQLYYVLFTISRALLGLGMSGGVLLILLFYILGLFYGMCGSTPSDVYSGECCDRSTGANMIAAASYLTFLLSTPLLLLTTAHFIIGE